MLANNAGAGVSTQERAQQWPVVAKQGGPLIYIRCPCPSDGHKLTEPDPTAQQSRRARPAGHDLESFPPRFFSDKAGDGNGRGQPPYVMERACVAAAAFDGRHELARTGMQEVREEGKGGGRNGEQEQ